MKRQTWTSKHAAQQHWWHHFIAVGFDEISGVCARVSAVRLIAPCNAQKPDRALTRCLMSAFASGDGTAVFEVLFVASLLISNIEQRSAGQTGMMPADTTIPITSSHIRQSDGMTRTGVTTCVQ
jgi:hypothetical protein